MSDISTVEQILNQIAEYLGLDPHDYQTYELQRDAIMKEIWELKEIEAMYEDLCK